MAASNNGKSGKSESAALFHYRKRVDDFMVWLGKSLKELAGHIVMHLFQHNNNTVKAFAPLLLSWAAK